MNINNVNTCVSLYRVTVAEVWNSLTNLEKKTNRNCATHGVVLVILVERMTSAIATSARITSAYFRAYNRVHCYCSGITIYYIIDCTCVYRVSLLVNWRCNDSLWEKKTSTENFDVTMGSYDGAETCEL